MNYEIIMELFNKKCFLCIERVKMVCLSNFYEMLFKSINGFIIIYIRAIEVPSQFHFEFIMHILYYFICSNNKYVYIFIYKSIFYDIVAYKEKNVL